MSVLSAQSIRERCKGWDDTPALKPMVEPFANRQEVVWYPPYKQWFDVNTGDRTKYMDHELKRLKLKRFSYGLSTCGYDVRIAQDIWLWPFFGRLASTIEKFNMPADVMAEVKDKSSWARRFVTVQNTVIEPGWRGTLTLELTNHRPVPRLIRAGTPIAQIIFYNLDKASEQPYNGKYQDQEPGPQPAR